MRCFLAIELPEPVKQELGDLQCRLGELDRAVRWTKPEQIHLTLHFLGDVKDSGIAALCQSIGKAAASLPPFEILVAGTGCFPPSGPPRVVWVGVQGPPPQLLDCHQRTGQAINEAGYPTEKRAYSPHLTVGRTRDGANARLIRPTLANCIDFAADPFIVSEIVLFQSILGPAGATHVALARAPLLGT